MEIEDEKVNLPVLDLQAPERTALLYDLIKPGKKVFFMGIGGVGMSALAVVMSGHGLIVSGSDVKRGRFIHGLERTGIRVFLTHHAEHLSGVDWAVYSSAISESNPELKEALRSGIPVYHRGEVLAALMNQAISLAITGTHGKTTSASLVSFLLTQLGLRPTCLVGGEILNFGTNVILGDSHLMVAEVDESDRSQLHFSPDYALITNLDSDHLDVYQTVAGLKQSFRQFVDQIKKTGSVIYCEDDSNIKEVIQDAVCGSSAVSYGLSERADFQAREIKLNGFGSRYVLFERGEKIGSAELNVPGLHNVVNSLGVIALLRRFGIRSDQFLKYLPDFQGAGRRLQVKFETEDLIVIDDYAHHPTEVSASLAALKELGKKVTVVFQPHRFSRTRYLAQEFAHAFQSADRVFLTEIYAAGELNQNQVSTSLIYEVVKASGHASVQCIPKNEMIDFLVSHRLPNEVIAFFGAGDIGDIADEFASRMQNADSI